MTREATPESCEEIHPRTPWPVLARDLLRYRQVLYALCGREVRGKYRPAVLGLSWAVVQPVVQVGIFTLVFRGVARVETGVPYPLFALASLLPFNLFQQILVQGCPAFANSRNIIGKIYFPRIFTVASACTTAVLNGAVTGVLLAGLLVAYGRIPGAGVLLAAACVVATGLLAFGLTAVLATVNARFRDVQHALPLLATVLMYVTPVLYPASSLPGSVSSVTSANPLAVLVEGTRAGLLGLEAPSAARLAAAILGSLGVFVAGIAIFERRQAALVDIL